jgi:Asp-tRNA(Asn)/Glu-tRNA(Gln) amidotransferase A subunit family amidase
MGPPLEEEKVLNIAYALEQAIGFEARPGLQHER